MLKNTTFLTLSILMFYKVFGQNITETPCIASGIPGDCKLPTNCTETPETTQKTCEQPLICCPQKRKVGNISKEKCKLYSTLASKNGGNSTTQNDCDKGGPVIAGKKEFPYLVYLGFDNDVWTFSGAIISENFVLTAAHCMDHPRLGVTKSVRFGLSNLLTFNHWQSLKVVERLPHPQYKAPQSYHDIGLLKLEKSIEFNDYARPACLYYNFQKTFDQVVLVEPGYASFEKYTLKTQDNTYCNKYLSKYSTKELPNGIDEETQKYWGNKDTICRFGYGGPLQIRNTDDDINCMWDIVGVRSHGIVCFNDSFVSPHIPKYLNWIEDTVWPEN